MRKLILASLMFYAGRLRSDPGANWVSKTLQPSPPNRSRRQGGRCRLPPVRPRHRGLLRDLPLAAESADLRRLAEMTPTCTNKIETVEPQLPPPAPPGTRRKAADERRRRRPPRSTEPGRRGTLSGGFIRKWIASIAASTPPGSAHSQAPRFSSSCAIVGADDRARHAPAAIAPG